MNPPATLFIFPLIALLEVTVRGCRNLQQVAASSDAPLFPVPGFI